MGKWIRLLSAGLLGLVGACRPFGSQQLPGSEYSSAWFTPDGGRVLVNSYYSQQIYLYDLAAKKIAWGLPARPLAGVSFSPAGKFVVLVEQSPNDPKAQLSVIRLADGVKSPFTMRLGEFDKGGLDDYYSKQAAAHTAVSDDGGWVVVAYGTKPLEVYSTADGHLVYQQNKNDMQLNQAQFELGDKRLAVRWTGPNEPAVAILAQSDGQWNETATLQNVLLYTWTTAGLGLVTPRGIEMWNDGKPRLVVPLVQRRGEFNAYAVDAYGTPFVDFSPDGAFAVAALAKGFDVFDLKSGVKIFAHHEAHLQSAHSPLLHSASFAGHHLRAFLETGNFIDVDLSIPKIVNKISFGSLGHYSKNWFTDGSSWVSNYQPMLGPGGRYVDLYNEKNGHEVYALP